mmetsp:Transcript_8711/g.26193  ORF Transcript_8711/g.26193 Transcript_8711/m.26193 type:complete len:172 (+) Transcript_8711:668-1183(+)
MRAVTVCRRSPKSTAVETIPITQAALTPKEGEKVTELSGVNAMRNLDKIGTLQTARQRDTGTATAMDMSASLTTTSAMTIYEAVENAIAGIEAAATAASVSVIANAAVAITGRRLTETSLIGTATEIMTTNQAVNTDVGMTQMIVLARARTRIAPEGDMTEYNSVNHLYHM